MKKVLSLVLVIAMVLSSFSFAFADTFEDIADTDYEKAVTTLFALGVVTGYEDGTYKPERVVTRAEMAKLLVEVLGFGDLVAGSKSNFTDTQGHWADPWIALAAGRGLVIGTGDGKFVPDRTVSYDEAITMIVRGLGYTDDSNEIKNMTWPTNFKVKAAELGITKNVKLSADGADRGGVAILLYNALEAELVTVNTDGDIVKSGKELLSRLAELDEDYIVSSELFDPTNKNYAGDMVDLAPYIYQSLKVYLNDDDEVVYIKDSNSLVIEGSVDEVTLSKSGKIATVAVETEDGSIKKLDFTVDVEDGLEAEIPGSIFENRASKSEATFKYLEDTETIKIVANEATNRSNGKIEEEEVDGFVLETQTKVARVEEVYEDGDDKFDVFTLPTNSKDEPDFNKIIVKGDADSLEDIEVDDVVVEYLAEDDAFTTLVVSRDTVEGEVTRIGETDVYVDGTKYKVSGTSGANDSIELGDEGVFYLDHNGKIVDFDGEGAGARNYAVVIGTAKGSIDTKWSESGARSLDDYPQLKVTTQEGEEVIYDVYLKLNTAGNKVTGTAKIDGKDLFEDADVDEETDITSTLFATLTNDKVIKISLNSDNKITKITTVTPTTIKNVDTTKSTFKLADNALIYNTVSDDVVSEGKLKAEITAKAVYSKNGVIEVLLVDDKAVDQFNYTFAYIYKYDNARKDGEYIQAVEAFVNGEKVTDLITDEDDTVNHGKDKVYGLDLKDKVIKEATLATTIAGKDGSGLVVTSSAIATSVRTGSNMIELNGKWTPVDENATVVVRDGSDEKLGTLRDIDANESILTVYIYDGVVVFIVIEDEEAPDPDPATGEVTYIDSDIVTVGKTDYEIHPAAAQFLSRYVSKGDKISYELTDDNKKIFKVTVYDGDITVTQDDSFEDLVIGGDLTVTNNATLNTKGVTVKGDTTVDVGAELISNTTFEGDVTVNGTAEFTNVTVKKALKVTGTATIKNSAVADLEVVSDANVAFVGKVTVSGDIVGADLINVDEADEATKKLVEDVIESYPPVVTAEFRSEDVPYQLYLDLSINKDIDFSKKADVVISYFKKDGSRLIPIHNYEAEADLVKDKTWDGYLVGEDNTKYSKGTANVEAYKNLIPKDTKVSTGLNPNSGYLKYEGEAVIDLLQDTIVVKIIVIDNNGNESEEIQLQWSWSNN